MFQLSRVVPPKVRNPETRLGADYVAAKFPDFVVLAKQPLGPGLGSELRRPPGGNTLRASRPWRPEVDYVVVMADASQVTLARNGRAGVVVRAPASAVLLLVEVKVKEYMNGIAKLPFYKALVATTPELAACAGCEIQMRLVVPRAAPWVEASAELMGVQIDLWEPAWITEYWEWRDSYYTRENRLERERVKEARARLGL
jgi:hypothetical protein